MEPLSSAVAQTTTSATAVVGTVGLLAAFLALTAHLAARNVLGDVAPSKALGVGIGPAFVSVGTELLSIPGGLGVLFALTVDGVAIHLLYGQPRRRTLYITAIHLVVTVICGTVLIGGLILVASVPG